MTDTPWTDAETIREAINTFYRGVPDQGTYQKNYDQERDEAIAALDRLRTSYEKERNRAQKLHDAIGQIIGIGDREGRKDFRTGKTAHQIATEALRD